MYQLFFHGRINLFRNIGSSVLFLLLSTAGMYGQGVSHTTTIDHTTGFYIAHTH